MKTQLEILEHARALIADPEHWTRGACARRVDGLCVDMGDTSAHCFCSIGAVGRATLDLDVYPSLSKTFDTLESLGIPEGTPVDQSRLATYNDSHTHEEVLAMFDRAIEKLRG